MAFSKALRLSGNVVLRSGQVKVQKYLLFQATEMECAAIQMRALFVGVVNGTLENLAWRQELEILNL